RASGRSGRAHRVLARSHRGRFYTGAGTRPRRTRDTLVPGAQLMSSFPRPSRTVALILISAACALVARPASAQYFGQNKAQYKDFGFRVMSTKHFDIYYYPEEQEAVEQASRMAERWYARLSRVLSHQLLRRQPIVLYASHTHFEQTNVLSGF